MNISNSGLCLIHDTSPLQDEEAEDPGQPQWPAVEMWSPLEP